MLIDDVVLSDGFVFGWFEILHIVAVGPLTVGEQDKFVGEVSSPAVGCGGPVWEAGEVSRHEGEEGARDASNNEIVVA